MPQKNKERDKIPTDAELARADAAITEHAAREGIDLRALGAEMGADQRAFAPATRQEEFSAEWPLAAAVGGGIKDAAVKASRLASGVTTGMENFSANALGAPVDIAAAITGVEEPVMGSEWLKKPAFQETFVPQGKAEEYAMLLGEESAASLVGLGALYAKIAQGAGKIRMGFKSRGIVQQMVEDLSKLPGKLLFKLERNSAVGASTGRHIAREYFPDDPSYEMYGSLLGALGPQGLYQVLRRAERFFLNKLPALTREGVKERVAYTLDKVSRASPEGTFDEGIETALELQKINPEQRLTLLEATKSPEAAHLAQRLDKASEGFRGAVEFNEGLRSGEMKRALTASMGVDYHSSDVSLMKALRQRTDLLDRRLNAAMVRAEDKLARYKANVQEDIGMEEVGRIIREQLDGELVKFRENSSTLFATIDPRNKVHVQPREVVEALQGIYTSWVDTAEGAKGMPGVIKRLAKLFIKDDFIQAAGGIDEALRLKINPSDIELVPFQQLAGTPGSARSSVLRAQRELRGGFGEYSGLKQKKLAELLDGIENTMNQLVVNPLFEKAAPGAVQRYREAAAYYREGRERLKSGTMQLLQKYNVGRRQLQVADIKVGGEILHQGPIGQQTADEYIRALGGNKAADNAVVQYAIHDIYQKGTREAADGSIVLVESRWKKWLSNHEEALKRFPKVREVLDDFHALEARMNSVRNRIQISLDERHKGALSLFLQGREPRMVMLELIKDTNGPLRMKQIIRKLGGDHDALTGLRKAYYEAMTESFEGRAYDRFNNLIITPDKADRFLSKNKEILRQLFNPRDLKFLENYVGTSLKIWQASQTRPGHIDINVLADPGQITQSWILSRWWGLKRHVVGLPFVLSTGIWKFADIKAQGFQQGEAAKLLREAYFDPEIARDLIQYWRVGPQKDAYKRLRGHLAALVGTLRFGGDAEEDLEYDVKITGPGPGEEKE